MSTVELELLKMWRKGGFSRTDMWFYSLEVAFDTAALQVADSQSQVD
jgi:hypothetical protein